MQGMRKHGIETFIGSGYKPSSADIAVLWSWKRPAIIKTMLATGRHLLIMERGFIQPRNQWVSLAVDGFNNRGRFAPAPDNGERWERLFAHHLRPWRKGGDYALLVGQVPGDTALNGADIVAWAQDQAARLIALGHKVVYRPHPEKPTPCPDGAMLSTGTLAEDLARAERVVAFSSTTAVEAVLAGIPTVVHDEGSVAWPMGSHDVAAPLARPDRTKWCHDLAWRQWSTEELKNGTAWAHVRRAIYDTSG
jgi:hypothetical protein